MPEIVVDFIDEKSEKMNPILLKWLEFLIMLQK